MIQKRPYVDENPEEVAYKHPRQLELEPNVSFDDNRARAQFSDDTGQKDLSQGEHVESSSAYTALESSHEGNKELEAGDTVRFPNLLWISNAIREADNLTFLSEYFDHERQLRALLQSDEVFSSVDYPFRKSVSVGPEYQAYVPDSLAHGPSTSGNLICDSDLQSGVAKSSTPLRQYNYVDEEKLGGTCIIPMPDPEAIEIYYSEVAKSECECVDVGSIRCVRQHIVEAREELRKNLGEEIFEKLGFGDMGEEVANRWADEEEEAFHQIILSNPASLGKNFWNHLVAAFPSRTKKEIVNYYFNVFMLRKRAEQNRIDPQNIDSDDDEWEIRDPGFEEDEDSVVESLNDQDVTHYREEDVAHFNMAMADGNEINNRCNGANGDIPQKVGTDDDYRGYVDDSRGAFTGCCGVELKSCDGIPCRTRDGSDVQDDSCTSFECQQNGADCSGTLDLGTNTTHSSDE